MFPFSISIEINSSINNTFLLNFKAITFSFEETKFGYSSLKPKIAEGSIPIKVVSLEIISLQVLTLLIAIFFDWFKNPFEIYALTLSSCLIISTLYPNALSSLTDFTPSSTS